MTVTVGISRCMTRSACNMRATWRRRCSRPAGRRRLSDLPTPGHRGHAALGRHQGIGRRFSPCQNCQRSSSTATSSWPTWTAACSAPSSSISAAASMAASSSRAIPTADEQGFRRDVMELVASLAPPSSAIPAATSSPATTGKTASARSSSGRAARPRLALDRDQPVRHQRVHRLVPHGRRRADARRQSRHARAARRRGASSNTATIPAAPRCPTCAARTAGTSRTASSSGASATRWTAPGRSAHKTARRIWPRRAARRPR